MTLIFVSCQKEEKENELTETEKIEENTEVIEETTEVIDSSKSADERDEIVGDYKGKRIDLAWKDTIVGYTKNFSDVTLTLSKNPTGSLVELSFNPKYWSSNFLFSYKNGAFESVEKYHPPTLILRGDSLFFEHHPGLGPNWTECNAAK